MIFAPRPPLIKSMPAPPRRMSFPPPPYKASSPSSPWSMSFPAPPINISASSPPISVSSPRSPRRRSWPRPPSSVSLPLPPRNRSFPAPPRSVSSPLPPNIHALIEVSSPRLICTVSSPLPALMRIVRTSAALRVSTTSPLTTARSTAASDGSNSTTIVSLGLSLSKSPQICHTWPATLPFSSSRGSNDSIAAHGRGRLSREESVGDMSVRLRLVLARFAHRERFRIPIGFTSLDFPLRMLTHNH